MQTKFYERGVSLIESIVALMILSAIGAALVALNVQIQSATNSARAKSFAESQAQKMIEQVRNEKNIGGGVNSLVDGCHYVGSDVRGTAVSPKCNCGATGAIDGNAISATQSQYKTFVNVETVGGGKQIEANVGWVEKGKNNCMKVVTVLYDY